MASRDSTLGQIASRRKLQRRERVATDRLITLHADKRRASWSCAQIQSKCSRNLPPLAPSMLTILQVAAESGFAQPSVLGTPSG